MNDIQQRLNKNAFNDVLKKKNMTQANLAAKLGVNEKSFSRWVNEGYIQSKYLWDLTEELDLSEIELDEVLMLTKFKVYFRKRYLGKPHEEIESHAIELAKTLFSLTYFNSEARFCPPNVSKLETAIEVANQVRRYIEVSSFNNLQGIVSVLAERGVEVAVVPFKKLGLISEGDEGKEEQAFTVTDEKRCLIFLDSASPEELLIFNLCHELCHLFRPDLDFSPTEEKFCNAVASELVYPKIFFDTHKQTIEKMIQSNSSEIIINLLNVIKENLGGEIWGISIKLKTLGYLSQKDELHKKIIAFAESSFKKLPKVGDKLFAKFNLQDKSTFYQFWESEEMANNNLLRFFFLVKNAATSGSLSARKFSELFRTDIGLSDEMFHTWKFRLLKDLEEQPNE